MKIFSRTDQGKVRKTNQDAFVARKTKRFVFGAVCDGMGGANAGNVASTLAAQVMNQCIGRGYIDEMDISGVKSILRQAIRDANRRFSKRPARARI